MDYVICTCLSAHYMYTYQCRKDTGYYSKFSACFICGVAESSNVNDYENVSDSKQMYSLLREHEWCKSSQLAKCELLFYCLKIGN